MIQELSTYTTLQNKPTTTTITHVPMDAVPVRPDRVLSPQRLVAASHARPHQGGRRRLVRPPLQALPMVRIALQHRRQRYARSASLAAAAAAVVIVRCADAATDERRVGAQRGGRRGRLLQAVVRLVAAGLGAAERDLGLREPRIVEHPGAAILIRGEGEDAYNIWELSVTVASLTRLGTLLIRSVLAFFTRLTKLEPKGFLTDKKQNSRMCRDHN